MQCQTLEKITLVGNAFENAKSVKFGAYVGYRIFSVGISKKEYENFSYIKNIYGKYTTLKKIWIEKLNVN